MASGDSEPARLWAGALPLSILGLGLALTNRRPRVAEALLLGAFPPTLLIAAYLHQPADVETGLSGYAVAIASVALMLYLVGTLRALGQKTELTPAVSARLDGDGEARSEPRRRIAGALWIALSAAGAFAVFAIAPYVPSAATVQEGFGDGATEVRLLMAAVGISLGLGALAFTVAPSLRARRKRDTGARGWLPRVLLYSLALSVAAALWWLARR